MNKIYNFYSHWIIILSMIEKWTKIYVYPSVIFCFIASTLLGLWYKLTFTTMIVLILMHISPFLWCKQTLSGKVVLHNFYYGILFIVFILVQNENIFKIYDEHFKFFQKPDSIKNMLFNKHLNSCLIC